MTCPQWQTTQAWFDGELDNGPARQAEQHAFACAECGALLQAHRNIREQLRATAGALRAPSTLQRNVQQLIYKANAMPSVAKSGWRMPAFWWGATAGSVCTALLVTMVVTLQIWVTHDTLTATLVQEHSSSLLTNRLVSIESSEHHTVKPWFASHADVSPVVEDLSGQGFQLVGGRVEAVQRQRAAVAVYRHGAHLVNVFSWANDSRSLTGEFTKRGFNLNCWMLGDVQYCAVSDVNENALRELQKLLTDRYKIDGAMSRTGGKRAALRLE